MLTFRQIPVDRSQQLVQQGQYTSGLSSGWQSDCSTARPDGETDSHKINGTVPVVSLRCSRRIRSSERPPTSEGTVPVS